jgi:amidohydrolase
MGTVRAFDVDVRARMSSRIEQVLRGVCEASGATYDFDYIWRYPVTSNDAEQTEYVRALATRIAGAANVAEVPQLMGAEDFSFFAERVPACFFSLGSGGSDATQFPHHHARFDLDEAALENGVRLMVALALEAPLSAP